MKIELCVGVCHVISLLRSWGLILYFFYKHCAAPQLSSLLLSVPTTSQPVHHWGLAAPVCLQKLFSKCSAAGLRLAANCRQWFLQFYRKLNGGIRFREQPEFAQKYLVSE